MSSETDLGLSTGATRRGGGPGSTFEYSLGDGTLLVDLALQSAQHLEGCRTAVVAPGLAVTAAWGAQETAAHMTEDRGLHDLSSAPSSHGGDAENKAGV